VRLHTLCETVRQFVHWPIGSFPQPYESHLPFTPVLTTRIITALPLLDVIVAFLWWGRRPVCKRWAYLVLTTHYTAQWAHAFQWLCKILLKLERGRQSNISFIIKIVQICCRKKWNSTILHHRNLFQRNQLETRPNFWNFAWKKANLATLVQSQQVE